MLWGNTDVKSGTGTIAIANVDANAIYGTLTGTSTLLGTEVKVGNYIIADGRKYLLVAITSNTAGVVAGDLTGVALANVDAGNTFTVQEGPAFIGSEDKGDLDDIFGVDITEAVVSGNASVQQYIVTFKGSGYFSAPTVTVDGNATATATANGTGYISVIAVNAAGNTYTVAPAVTVDPPAEQTFNANTALIKDNTFNALTGVANTTEFITTTSAHGLSDGDKVQYLVAAGNTEITGIVNGTSYFVVSSNTTALQLALTAGGANLNLTAGVSETGHTLRRVGQGYITISSNKFQVGDKVVYDVKAGNTAISPLVDGTTYHVASSNSTTISIAAVNGGAALVLVPGAGETGHGLTGETATAAAVLSSGGDKNVAHAGWVKRTVGTGGRAGRVFYETLVAGGTIGGDQEDAVFKDA
jgi:hypothetical protein